MILNRNVEMRNPTLFMLDLSNPSLTVASIGKAAAALGRKVELRFVPA